MVSHPYLGFLPPPPPGEDQRWGGLAAPTSVLPMPMGREQPGRKIDSALRAMYPLSDSLPI